MKKYIEAIEQGEGENLDFIQEEVESDYSETKKQADNIELHGRLRCQISQVLAQLRIT